MQRDVMKILANKDIRHFFLAITFVMAGFLLFFCLAAHILCQPGFYLAAAAHLAAWFVFLAACLWYFQKQNRAMEDAASRVEACLLGDKSARIDCDEEGEMYRLFHLVNTLASVLNAQAEKEQQAKEFLKNMISDISHQLKTPLAALNIYNGLLQEEAEETLPRIREFAVMSEQELDRMETLIQNLLKITKLDAGSMVFEKLPENVADMMKDVELHFAYRARQEGKKLVFSGEEKISFLCDRHWIVEAFDNLVKNALDHTGEGGCVWVEWRQVSSMIRISVKDNGSGIHPEDLHHIFKRFYRSRFSQDTQGVGLGLPLAKAMIEEHDGMIEVDSKLGAGTTFVVTFLIPTKL